jgi:hypothetical protein
MRFRFSSAVLAGAVLSLSPCCLQGVSAADSAALMAPTPTLGEPASSFPSPTAPTVVTPSTSIPTDGGATQQNVFYGGLGYTGGYPASQPYAYPPPGTGLFGPGFRWGSGYRWGAGYNGLGYGYGVGAPCGGSPCGSAPCGAAPCGPAPCGPCASPNYQFGRGYDGFTTGW